MASHRVKRIRPSDPYKSPQASPFKSNLWAYYATHWGAGYTRRDMDGIYRRELSQRSNVIIKCICSNSRFGTLKRARREKHLSGNASSQTLKAQPSPPSLLSAEGKRKENRTSFYGANSFPAFPLTFTSVLSTSCSSGSAISFWFFAPTCWFKFMNVYHKERNFSFCSFFYFFLYFFWVFLYAAVFVRKSGELAAWRISTRCPCVWPDTWHKHLAWTRPPNIPRETSRSLTLPAWVLVSNAGCGSPARLGDACLLNWLSTAGRHLELPNSVWSIGHWSLLMTKQEERHLSID